MGLHSVMPAEGRWPIGRRGGAPVLMLAHRCCVGRAAGLCARRGRVGVDAVASKPGVAKKCCRSRDGSYACVCSKGGSRVNTTLCRTHGLKSGDRRRPETERQGLAPRPSHDSRVASEEFVTLGPPVLIRLSGPPGSLHAPRHSGASSIRGSNRPKSPRRTVQRPSSVTGVVRGQPDLGEISALNSTSTSVCQWPYQPNWAVKRLSLIHI